MQGIAKLPSRKTNCSPAYRQYFKWKYTNQNVYSLFSFLFFIFFCRCHCCCCFRYCCCYCCCCYYSSNRRDMNVNAVPVLLDHIAKKSMLVHRVHVPTMAFALIYLKDTMEIRINVYALTVSLTEFLFFSLSLFPLHSLWLLILLPILMETMTVTWTLVKKWEKNTNKYEWI